MAEYLNQRERPPRGDYQFVEHKVQLLSSDSPVALQSDVDTFMASLTTIAGRQPYIQSIQYQVHDRQGVNDRHNVLIHYTLAGV